MAKHKAPTQVTIAATGERTFLHDLVERYWKTAAGVSFLVVVGILVGKQMSLSGQADTSAKWDRLGEEVKFQLFGNFESPAPAVLADLSSELGSSKAASWAKAAEVAKRVEEGDISGAKTALQELKRDWPDHALITDAVYPSPNGDLQTLAQRLDSRTGELEAWEASHRFLFENPPLPTGAPRVRITTSRGDLVVGLYSDRAPKHVENFLKLCREGYYDNTRFHRVIRDFMIQGGDPNTKEGEADESWGQGGPDYTIEAEIDPELRHFKGFLAGAKKPGADASSGSQFYITTADYHSLDGDYTIFGKLLEGEDVAREIETGAVVGDRPQDPVAVLSTTILE